MAIKVLKKKKMSETDFADLEGEIEIMSSLDHPNIIRLLEVYDEDSNYFLVYELMRGGDMSDSINAEYEVSERTVQRVVAPIFDAVLYCHDLGIMHRDLKPENFLLTHSLFREATVKIADFGLSRFFDEDKWAKTIAGTPAYIAPEIISKQPYSEKCDFWSLGVILFLLLSGKLPFMHEDHFQMFKLIKAGEYD